MLYSGECRQTFWGVSSNIPVNVAKHSVECRQIFRGISWKVSGNVLKHSGECSETFRGMFWNIPENVSKHSGKCSQTFRRMSPNILGNVAQKFRGIALKIPRNSQKGLAFKFNGRTPKHGTVLLNYLLFAVGFTSAKKSTRK